MCSIQFKSIMIPLHFSDHVVYKAKLKSHGDKTFPFSKPSLIEMLKHLSKFKKILDG